MSFIVIYDANVLYPNTLRDLLIRIAQQPHLVQAKWTGKILDEMLSALRRNRPDIGEEKTERLRERMNAAVRDCLVEGYEPLIDILDLPDPDDRHVLAAAIKVNAQLIDQEPEGLSSQDTGRVGHQAEGPRRFRPDVLDLDPQAVWACIQQIVDSRTRHPVTTADVLDELERDGPVASAAAIRLRAPLS